MNPQQINIQVQYLNFSGCQMALNPDPLYILSISQAAFIKQSVEMLEVMTNNSCETKNRYSVYTRDNQGVFYFLFRCKEDSGYYERYYCHGDSRPFLMKMKHVTNPHVDDDFLNTYAVLDRPFKCTCCCYARPMMTGYFGDINGKQFGQIEEPCTYCDPLYLVKDSSENVKFKISADCCQYGIMCRDTCCGKCSEVEFNIFDGKTDDLDEKARCGVVRKLVSDVVKELMTDADTFEINFPQNASPEEKLLIIGAVLMIDYRFYEESPADKNDHS